MKIIARFLKKIFGGKETKPLKREPRDDRPTNADQVIAVVTPVGYIRAGHEANIRKAAEQAKKKWSA
jgi:hypothetical protein